MTDRHTNDIEYSYATQNLMVVLSHAIENPPKQNVLPRIEAHFRRNAFTILFIAVANLSCNSCFEFELRHSNEIPSHYTKKCLPFKIFALHVICQKMANFRDW